MNNISLNYGKHISIFLKWGTSRESDEGVFFYLSVLDWVLPYKRKCDALRFLFLSWEKRNTKGQNDKINTL